MILHFYRCFRYRCFRVSDFYLVDRLHLDAPHRRPERVPAVTRPPVHSGAYESFRSLVLRQAEEFVDVALPVPEMDATRRLAQQFGGLLQVLQPANTLFGLDRHSRGVDLPLQGIGPLELAPGPELDRRQPER